MVWTGLKCLSLALDFYLLTTEEFVPAHPATGSSTNTAASHPSHGSTAGSLIVQGHILFSHGAGAAFPQRESGFISPGSSGLCLLVLGRFLKTLWWEDFLIRVQTENGYSICKTVTRPVWYHQTSPKQQQPGTLLFNYFLLNIVWVSLTEGSTW